MAEGKENELCSPPKLNSNLGSDTFQLQDFLQDNCCFWPLFPYLGNKDNDTFPYRAIVGVSKKRKVFYAVPSTKQALSKCFVEKSQLHVLYMPTLQSL